MCRLYGLRANEETKVECTLVHAQNALMLQSRSDRAGRTHMDGWGIAFYHNTVPEVERRSTAAHQDLHFSNTAERIFSQTVVAHVRHATIGATSDANSHPFVWNRWAFAHNGTVQGFDTIRNGLEQETEPRLQAHRRGHTDSEQLFLWLLSRIEEAGIDLSLESDQSPRLATVAGACLAELAGRCARAAADKPARLNIILTDGHRFLATRWNNSLYYVLREGVHDCEVCGIPHVHHRTGLDYRAVVVASEPISNEPWREIPNHSLLLVDEGLSVEVRPIESSKLAPSSS